MLPFDLFGNPTEGGGSVSRHASDGRSEQFQVQLSSEFEQVVTTGAERRRIPMLGFVVSGLVLSLIILQCFRLQIVGGKQNADKASGNSIRLITDPAERGLIVDSNGVVLAQNQRRTALTVDPLSLPRKKADREAVYEELKTIAGVSDEMIRFVEKNLQIIPSHYPVKTRLTQDETLVFTEKFINTPGVKVTEIPSRQYEAMASIGHIIGYVDSASEASLRQGRDFTTRTGKAGLETIYNDELSGTPGISSVEVNAQQQVIRTISSPNDSPSIAGNTLKLSIDSALQNKVAEALKNELSRRTAKYGELPRLGASVVIIDVNTGKIRAMVSMPDYNSQQFAEGISQDAYAALQKDPGNPLLNRVIQGAYAPGSTLKPLVAAAGLEENLITKDTSVFTPEALEVGGSRFPDWKFHGQTNTRKALAESNNIFFYALGGGWKEGGINGLGVDRLNRYLAQFGLSKKTGIDLPGEISGLLPDDAWKRANTGEKWFIGNTYQSSIGQGFLLATPLQMAVATAAIANNGTVLQPTLVQSFIKPDGTEVVTPTVSTGKAGVSEANLQTVREGMRQAVESGSARYLNGLQVKSAGKTGTAQFGSQGLTHAWYTGYAPYDKPEVAFAIMIEGGGESFYSSVPTTEEVLRAYFNEPLQPGQKLLSEPTDARTAEIAAEFTGER